MRIHVLLTGAFLLLTLLVTRAQPAFNYDAAWKRVHNLQEKEGLTRSAEKEIQSIYEAAKREKNTPQQIKALVYRVNLWQQREEDAASKALQELERELLHASGMAKALLQSIVAEGYWQYLQQNRWRLYDRTQTIKFKQTDISTWSVGDLHQKITSLYKASLRDVHLLQKTRLEGYEAVLQKGNTRRLRSTLYDLLVHRALDYYENDERTIHEPVDAFRINELGTLAPVDDFIVHRFATTDSSSLHYQALLLHQQLLHFLLQNGNTEAMLDADLRRIAFVYAYNNHPQKNEAYRKVLNQLWNQYNYEPVVAQAAYLLARSYADEAATYNPKQHKTDDAFNPRHLYKRAAALCQQVVQQQVLTEGKSNCIALLQEIEQKDIRISSEAVVVPQQPFRIQLKYRNVGRVWIRIIQKPENYTNRSWDTSFWDQLVRIKPMIERDFVLPAADDHQPHSIEVPLPELNSGNFVLLISATPGFERKRNLLAAHRIYSSNIAWMQQGIHLFVVHREAGTPLPQSKINMWEQHYDYGTRNYQNKLIATFTTDAQGYLALPRIYTATDEVRTLEIIHNSDTLHLNDRLSTSVYEADVITTKAEKRRSFLFTDRSIYRPGQTIYFKGIITEVTGANRYKTVARKKVIIRLFDANDQIADSLEVESNTYGSYTGSFTVPTGLLNGQFRLEESDSRSSYYVAVEAYKRPLFYVSYDPVQGSYRIHDTVQVSGTAQAYAGFGIDGAQVRYRVTRETRLPFPWLCYQWGWPTLHSQELVQGETTTDMAGKFRVSFPALPDPAIRSELLPVYTYKIIADVTDRNGETRSQTTFIRAGATSLLVSILLPQGESVATDQFRQVAIKLTNQMEVPVAAPVTVSVHRLLVPNQLIRNRYWDEPDQFLMEESEFRKIFPNDEYKDETKKESWARGPEVYRQQFTSSDSGNTYLRLQQPLRPKWQPGWYVMEASVTDTFGIEIKNRTYFELIDAATGAPGQPAYVWGNAALQTAQPGDTIRVRIGSSATNVWVVELPHSTTDQLLQYHSLTNNSKTIPLYITEENRGGTGRSFAFVRHNRFFQFNRQVAVPWHNKELDISLTTWRNTLLPGSTETWTVTVKGPKGDQVAAELLTAMYDASLDAFRSHEWNIPALYPTTAWNINWQKGGFYSSSGIQQNWIEWKLLPFEKKYDQLYTLQLGDNYRSRSSVLYESITVAADQRVKAIAAPPAPESNAPQKKTATPVETLPEEKLPPKSETGIRSDFRETAFFNPQLQTDSAGNIRFSFTMPEALTRWKWLLLAHTNDLSFGLRQEQVITQKDVMVQPFAPRFLREGDRFEFTTKVVNLTNQEQTGLARLQLLNATTQQPVDGWFQNAFPEQYFTVGPNQSTTVQFRTEVPYNFNEALTYRITAVAGKHTDGEERTLPVLTNRTLVTESLPLTMQGNGSRNFRMESLLQSGKSETLTHHRFTLEFTSNPVWYAVQALPYLMEQADENSMQLWNRFYAHALALHIVEKLPRIRRIFESWQTTDTSALLSNLQKNEALKNTLLQETPWVLQARSESEQKKQIALLFNLVRMAGELQGSLQQLQQYQANNGGFIWLNGGPDDRYMTQYILSGIGRLQQLKAVPKEYSNTLQTIADKALLYLDNCIKEDYQKLLQSKVKLQQLHISSTQIQYLYMRSFFTNKPISKGVETAFLFYQQQARTYWLRQPRYLQGMVALALHRNGQHTTAQAILRSLKENALQHPELGMYWKEWNAGYYWYQAPVEAQSLMIEAFREVAKDDTTVTALKTWLLRQKQVQHWRTSRATAEACYALLLQGTHWVADESVVEIKAANQFFNSGTEKTEAGTGYFQRTLEADKIKPELGNIEVILKKSNNQPAWGAAYWQYFDNLDQIQSANTSLQLEKKYFVKTNSKNGPVLMPIEDGEALQVGDRVVVRLVLRTDRALEYVHLKDMRPSCLEPVDVMSGYRWQDALGYYQSTRDASTSFFVGWMPRGTYTWEYELTATHAGNYSSGIATLQCLYAPEFSSHSEGIRLKVRPR